MSIPMALLGIFLFAVVTAVLMVWGMRKSYFQRETLNRMLLSKASERVMRYLKNHDTITESEILKMAEGISAAEFHSRSRATVQEGQAFTAQLIDVMQRDGLIEPAQKGGRIYRKKDKK